MLTLCRWIARLRARRLRRDIDEDTHLNHRPKPTTMVVFPQKRAPIKVFVQSFDQTARTSPSTFLFLLSSHCQRADPRSLSKGGVIGDISLHILKGTASCLRLPGSNPALSEDHRQWERPALGVVSAAGSSRGRRACQHPFSVVPQKVSSETPPPYSQPTQNLPSRSTTCLARTTFPQPRLSDVRLIRDTPFQCQRASTKKMTASSHFPFQALFDLRHARSLL
ncbi:hypothetical protein SAMN02983003_2974 [Devosia enhydra]|uniref:Uncharacterized protein n=1 Tax=Devosia enhydra TaxID=665118 RepID=A0A1K2I226_9HYPH|nr:hypothetical protein SAMN02983003_2974 [Devosia enhydra]